MTSTLQLLQNATGMEKLSILAAEIDALKRERQEVGRRDSLDDQIATVDLSQLAETYRVSLATFRSRIRSVMGDSAVFRMGKAWVMRKTTYLEYLRQLEAAPGHQPS